MLSAESAQANSPTIITVYDDHLSNATSNYFFVSQMKKNLSKTMTENFIQWRNRRQTLGTMLKR